MAEPPQLETLYSKEFDIQDFTNSTAAHFVAKCHAVNSSQKSRICRLYLR